MTKTEKAGCGMKDFERPKRHVFVIVGVVALACCGASDLPKPVTPEVLAQRIECGKLGAAWIKQHPLPKSTDGGLFTASIFYSPKTNQCWLIKSHVLLNGYDRIRHLIDAQTSVETMVCFDATQHPDLGYPKQDCDYMNNVENANLVSGFMAVPLPSQDQGGAKKGRASTPAAPAPHRSTTAAPSNRGQRAASTRARRTRSAWRSGKPAEMSSNYDPWTSFSPNATRKRRSTKQLKSEPPSAEADGF